MKQPLHMWSYWRDKYGVIDALEGYFPEILASDEILKYAHTQYNAFYLYVRSPGLLDLEEQMKEASEEIIENRMKELIEAETE